MTVDLDMLGMVLERELEFRDRVRGEWLAPWGVAEARRLAREWEAAFENRQAE